MKEKKEKESEPSPRQAQQSKPTHGFSKKKKNKTTQNQKSNLPTIPTVTSLQRKPIPNTLIQSIQSKSKTNQKQYCVYQKKKKNPIQSLCTKTAKPNQKNPNTRSSVAVTRSSSSSPQLAPRPHPRHSPLIADCKSQTVDHNRRSLYSAPVLDARCQQIADPSEPFLSFNSLKVFLISLSFSLSVSLSLSH